MKVTHTHPIHTEALFDLSNPYSNLVVCIYMSHACQNQSKSEVCKTATLHFDIRVASSSIVFMIHAAS